MKIKLTGLGMSGYVDVHPDTPPIYFVPFKPPIGFGVEDYTFKILFEFNGKMENDVRIYELVNIE